MIGFRLGYTKTCSACDDQDEIPIVMLIVQGHKKQWPLNRYLTDANGNPMREEAIYIADDHDEIEVLQKLAEEKRGEIIEEDKLREIAKRYSSDFVFVHMSQISGEIKHHIEFPELKDGELNMEKINNFIG